MPSGVEWRPWEVTRGGSWRTAPRPRRRLAPCAIDAAIDVPCVPRMRMIIFISSPEQCGDYLIYGSYLPFGVVSISIPPPPAFPPPLLPLPPLPLPFPPPSQRLVPIELTSAEKAEVDVDAAVETQGKLKGDLFMLAVWITAAVLFGAGVWFVGGPTMGQEYFAGYLLEQSLSVDNLFVFILIFQNFKTPAAVSCPASFSLFFRRRRRAHAPHARANLMLSLSLFPSSCSSSSRPHVHTSTHPHINTHSHYNSLSLPLSLHLSLSLPLPPSLSLLIG